MHIYIFKKKLTKASKQSSALSVQCQQGPKQVNGPQQTGYVFFAEYIVAN